MTYISALEDGVEPVLASSIVLTVERTKFLKAITHVQSIVEKRNTLPILANVKLVAENNLLQLTATDMDIAICENVEANITTQGALTVPAHTLYEIIRKLPDGSQVEMEGDTHGSSKLYIRSGSCEFSLSCLSIDNYPDMDEIEDGVNFKVHPSELALIIDKAKFSMSNEETRYYLNGLFFHLEQQNEGNFLSAVATDGHRLSKGSTNIPDDIKNMPGIIVPKKTVNEVRKILEEITDEIDINVSKTKIAFSFGEAIILSKLIDGNFPDYNNVVPKNNTKLLSIKKTDFMKAIDRVSTVSSDKTKAIKLTISPNKLILSATNEENGSAFEELEANYTEDEFDIGFNSKYLLEIISAVEASEAHLYFENGGAPLLVKDPACIGSLFVLMPMRI